MRGRYPGLLEHREGGVLSDGVARRRRGGPRRVLFLCTGNSARSQMAEALLRQRAGERVIVGSAGSNPAAQVHPEAVCVLRQQGIEWKGRRPRGIDEAAREPWDLVVTVCSRVREACPVLPGRPRQEHWDLDDPTAIEDGSARRRAFESAFQVLSRRIDGLLASLSARSD